LELSFSTTELREICEKRAVAVAALGLAAALELEQRLADIEASDTAAELSALFPDDISNRTPVERGLRIKAGYWLVFCSGHVRTPTTSAGATDWDGVTRMRVVALEADHG
jgi:hypothetical protein